MPKLALLVVTLAAAMPTPAVARPHLLIDGAWITRQSGVTRTVSQPWKLGPIIDGVRDHNYQPYLTVLRDGPRFRLWYGAKLMPGERLQFGYTTSRDGLHFRRPTFLGVPAGYQYGASIVRGPSGFVMPFFAKPTALTPDEDKGIKLAHSPDGLRWSTDARPPLFTPAQVGFDHAVGDITSITRYRGRYMVFMRMNGPGYEGSTPSQLAPGYRRIVGVMTSRDGRHWTRPRPILEPDGRDEGITEFYGLGGVKRRGNMLVGFLRVLRDDLPADPGGPVEGIGYTVLAWSHDGIHWRRDRQPFLDRSIALGWDHAMAWADAQLDVGNRTLVYYGGYSNGHKSDPLTQRLIGAAQMVRDRYVGRTGGTMTTVRMPLQGLTLNQTGTIRLRVGGVFCVSRGDGVAVRPSCAGRLPARGRITARLGSGVLYGVGA